MTQDVQPLTWQKRTNLEEHQQFFSKINEIIDNLAPTMDEAEAAIATANAASAAASAAASQAQTAASTVAGYDTRLTAAEGDIDSLQAADQTISGNVAALGTRLTAAESKNSQQDTAISELQTADAQNVKINRINEYAVGLTGNQTVAGIKTHTSQIVIERSRDSVFIDLKRTNADRTATQNSYLDLAKIRIIDANSKDMFWVDSYVDTGDRRVIQLQVFNSDGTSNGYIQFINTGAGVKSINTNFPKPSNW